MNDVKKIDISKEVHTKIKMLQIELSKYGKINLQQVSDVCIENGLEQSKQDLTRIMKENCRMRQSLICICGHPKFDHGSIIGTNNCTKSYCKCKGFESVLSREKS